MSLNIKNERVHELAREASRLTGKSQTGAVEEALLLLLAQAGQDPQATDRARRIDLATALSLQWDPETPARPAAPRDVEDLYDRETGLPA